MKDDLVGRGNTACGTLDCATAGGGHKSGNAERREEGQVETLVWDPRTAENLTTCNNRYAVGHEGHRAETHECVWAVQALAVCFGLGVTRVLFVIMTIRLDWVPRKGVSLTM